MDEEIEDRARLYELFDLHGIYSFTVRAEMLEDVGRALRLLEQARANPGRLTSPVGWAIARFRAGADPAHELERKRAALEQSSYVDDFELELPTLEAVTYIFGVAEQQPALGHAIVRLVDAALMRLGGYPGFVDHLTRCKAELHERRHTGADERRDTRAA